MIFILKNSYITNLNNKFYTRINPVPVKNPKLLYFNNPLANELNLNLESLNLHELSSIFSGNKIIEGSTPIALVYAGHQFGRFVPQLGDGRAILLGEVIDQKGVLRDIQLKGSGQTPYSRKGDGRAALGPMIREYIVSEAMHCLRIKTTRALALVETGEFIIRESIMPGVILTRVATSHIRIGTFEYFAAVNDLQSLKLLADYVIERHYPVAKLGKNPYLSLIESVIEAQVNLVVDWMRVGFIHGVMNTDNTSLSGETIDYGPCAFMDEYNYNKAFSSIDYNGRYSYGNQANILLWNIMQLFNSLKKLITNEDTRAKDLQNKFSIIFIKSFETKWLKTMGNKIGIIEPIDEDKLLIELLLNIMQENELDFTLTFKYLTNVMGKNKWPLDILTKPFAVLDTWIIKWKIRIKAQNLPEYQLVTLMNNINPSVIPRNHLIEQIIQEALTQNNFSKMYQLLNILACPYEDLSKKPLDYILPPKFQDRVKVTFCGT